MPCVSLAAANRYQKINNTKKSPEIIYINLCLLSLKFTVYYSIRIVRSYTLTVSAYTIIYYILCILVCGMSNN